ncbi:MAG: N-acyl homoserine lactonase family protein [Pseudomonadota bacterium]
MFKRLGFMGLLVAAACSQPDTVVEDDTAAPAPSDVSAPASPQSNTAVSALEMYIMDCGVVEVSDLDAFSSAGDYAGQMAAFGNSCFLIRHPEGDLMWDLGLPTELAGSAPQQTSIFTVSMEFTLTDQLAELGLSPRDIEYVSISHSHFDHSGQAGQFPNSIWLVHADEYALMFPPDAANDDAASEEQADNPAQNPFIDFASLTAEQFTGEKDVFGDGSVVIYSMPGHTPGHTSLLVDLPEAGPILLTGDLYHRRESRELKRVPRFNHDEEETLASMDAFEALAAEKGARVVIQHSAEDLAELPASPQAIR